ncbi:alpha-amylase family glycosyl hydrolase [Methylobacterium sp. J-059]|uniref:alpha-amylase family glycosyl hydrolase n=1 Tax=Methylobacterium sp. J-059 TaxID=2836643 RepID=UPI001FB93CDB|nr:alpha-amylase family glycosyl hydrolase [Methylobacterium sp. J-059]MCJ2041703.1 alpha-amylase family glycosyl hydrolase [Methylobacterium sp. J-059]
MPDWIRDTVWWQVYPLGFVGAEGTRRRGAEVAHRLNHIVAWLDYAADLGATGLALGPIFASETHGYDTIDYLRIDPRLGDEADFDRLIAAAHARGLKVLLDGVFNHVGQDFPAFRTVLDEGPSAARAGWFHLSWPEGTNPGDVPDHRCFEGHSALVTLNHDHPEVADHVVAVMNHWLARGADGWRLDAAYAVPRAFWTRVLPRVRAAHPDAYLVGEVIHGDYAGIVAETGLDSVTQYELWKAIWSGLNDCNLFELAHALKRHDDFLDAFVPMTFVGNHDVTRIASRIADIRHLPHALAVLLTVGGTPSIYAGDEQAFRGIKEDRAGGDDAIRPAFPPSPDDLAPEGWPTYRLHQDLIALRRRHPWLHTARTRALHLTNTALTLEAHGDGQRLLLALNLSDEPSEQPAPGALGLEAGQGEVIGEGESQARIRLSPHGWAILAAKA